VTNGQQTRRIERYAVPMELGTYAVPDVRSDDASPARPATVPHSIPFFPQRIHPSRSGLCPPPRRDRSLHHVHIPRHSSLVLFPSFLLSPFYHHPLTLLYPPKASRPQSCPPLPLAASVTRTLSRSSEYRDRHNRWSPIARGGMAYHPPFRPVG
jgi:hypothetical protein